MRTIIIFLIFIWTSISYAQVEELPFQDDTYDNFFIYDQKLFGGIFIKSREWELEILDITNDFQKLSSFKISYFPYDIIKHKDKYYIGGNDLTEELYVTDGTTEGTQILLNSKELPGGHRLFAHNFFVVYDKVFFIGLNRDLMVTDGTKEGTYTVKHNFAFGVKTDTVTEYNGKYYFQCDHVTAGKELCVTDGTTEGTDLVININRQSVGVGSYPVNFHILDGKLIFTAYQKKTGSQVWQSDGTEQGTELIDLDFLTVHKLFKLNDKLIIHSWQNNDKQGLFILSSLTKEPVLYDELPNDANGLGDAIIVGDSAYFFMMAFDSDADEMLWRTKGVADSTALISNKASYYRSKDVVANSLLYKDCPKSTGCELYVIDNNRQSPRLLIEFAIGKQASWGSKVLAVIDQEVIIRGAAVMQSQDKYYKVSIYNGIINENGSAIDITTNSTELALRKLRELRKNAGKNRKKQKKLRREIKKTLTILVKTLKLRASEIQTEADLEKLFKIAKKARNLAKNAMKKDADKFRSFKKRAIKQLNSIQLVI